ncbi:siroheme decarboxylase subunit alpha [Pampinifervens florentissimum]|uniref:siroheme decarboxylase subunit alpha n=1 Tax=Pampinifervens florentissimum TaxID=1632019 RepID=UPI0013B47D33|nr:Lrp/AsnC family transcriptional regulator [Hydrogenobacter sp. T-8]QID33488.1 Lrp/AsnC family transcriptional regulator [Hydrogenobacter sp. T-8]
MGEYESLLKEVQQEIPITQRPFLSIGDRLSMKEEEVIEVLKTLKQEKIIRQISPIYDTRMLGYDSSLVAFRVELGKIEDVARFINSHPGVSHNYEREDEFNLWFTLAVPPNAPLSLEDTVRLMAQRVGVKDFVILRTVRMFKIGVRLTYENLEEREEVEERELIYRPLEDIEIRLVKVTQEDMPLVKRPFLEWSKKLGVKEQELIELMRSLKERGILRRIGAILFHRRAGWIANGMAVWNVEKERVEEVGRFIAGFKGVSHCYERTTNAVWRYNLFSMVHGRDRGEVEALVRKIAEELSLKDYKVLFSKREFKKRRVRYFTEEFYLWYRDFIGAVSSF